MKKEYMKLLSILLVLLLSSMVNSEKIGDFAPLNVGNIWVYQSTYHHYTIELDTILDTALITRQIISSFTQDKKSYFVLKTKIEKKHRFISGPKSKKKDITTYNNSIEIDTLYEHNDTIYSITEISRSPVFKTHYFNSDSVQTGRIDYSQQNNILKIHTPYSIGGVSYYYQADVGLVGYSRYSCAHWDCKSDRLKLISFSDAPLLGDVQHPHSLKYIKDFRLFPRMVIYYNYKRVDLLGRRLKNLPFKQSPSHFYIEKFVPSN